MCVRGARPVCIVLLSSFVSFVHTLAYRCVRSSLSIQVRILAYLKVSEIEIIRCDNGFIYAVTSNCACTRASAAISLPQNQLLISLLTSRLRVAGIILFHIKSITHNSQP